MLRKLFFLLAALYASYAHAQVAIATDPNPPNDKAMLDIRSGTKGLLIPRMTTTQRLAIAPPIPNGLAVFDYTTMSFWYSYYSNWYEIQNSTANAWGISPFGI